LFVGLGAPCIIIIIIIIIIVLSMDWLCVSVNYCCNLSTTSLWLHDQ